MIYLDDLLNAEPFDEAVLNLARAFREKHGLPQTNQLGLVAPEVEDAAHALNKTRKIGPFFVAEGKPERWQERGEDRTYKGQLGFAYHKGFELELLEPGEGSDFYRAYVDPDGRTVVHHLGFFVKDVDAWAEKLAAAGYPLWVRGRLRAAFITSDFAYMDTVAEAGIIIEFITWRILSIRFKPPGFLYHLIGRLQKLLGIRSFST